MASFAAESARILPRISQWPGIHWMWVRVTILLMERRRMSRSVSDAERLYRWRGLVKILFSPVNGQLHGPPIFLVGAHQCCASIHHVANDIRSYRVAGGDDSIYTSIRGACASRPVSIDVILSFQLTGSADLMVKMGSWRLAMPKREGWTGQDSAVRQTSVPRAHGQVSRCATSIASSTRSRKEMRRARSCLRRWVVSRGGGVGTWYNASVFASV